MIVSLRRRLPGWPAHLAMATGFLALPFIVVGPGSGTAETNSLRRLVVDAGFVPYSKPEPAESFVFVDVRTGAKVDFREEYAGKVTVVNMWATWCRPCVTELPTLTDLQKSFEGQPVAVVLVNYEAPALQTSYLDLYSPTLRSLQGNVSKLAVFPHTARPSTVVVNRLGRVVAYKRGPENFSSEAMKVLVRYLVAQQQVWIDPDIAQELSRRASRRLVDVVTD